MHIGVVGGTGYVGIVMSCLANFGFNVTLVGRNEKKISSINDGISPIYEKGLDDVLRKAVDAGKLSATSDYALLNDSEIIFIAVGTPSKGDGSIDLSSIEDASRKIGELLKASDGYRVIVVKSTVLPTTTEKTIIPILQSCSGKKAGRDFGVCVNPEFLREGCAVEDFLKPDKILIGSIDDRSYNALEQLYGNFDKSIPRIRTDLSTAEMIKYAQNAALASRVSFINEVANICEAYGIDVKEVESAIGTDDRIGNKFMRAGAGFGGNCLPKDLDAMITASESMGIDPVLLRGVKSVNERQPLKLVDIAEASVGSVDGKDVAVLGTAFKPGTDDIRNASSIRVINELLSRGAFVRTYDPRAIENTRMVFGDRISYANSIGGCVDGADLCILVTEWDEFKELENIHINCPVIDGRRLLDPESIKSKGLQYAGIGWKNKV